MSAAQSHVDSTVLAGKAVLCMVVLMNYKWFLGRMHLLLLLLCLRRHLFVQRCTKNLEHPWQHLTS